MKACVRPTLLLVAWLGTSPALLAQLAADQQPPVERIELEAAAGDVAQVVYDAAHASISWMPLTDYGSFALTVSGPRDWFVSREFPVGTLPFLRLFGAGGSFAPDGGYDWMLTLTPRLDPAVAAALAAARADGANPQGLADLSAHLPARGANVQSGHFHVQHGRLVLPGATEPSAEAVGRSAHSPRAPGKPSGLRTRPSPWSGSSASVAGAGSGGVVSDQDDDFGDAQVFVEDLIVEASACIGVDCVNGESFGFDTIRMKENNLRIAFQDTSSTSSFPTVDWQLTANDTANGGANKFSIDDVDGGKTPFTIEAGAPNHSLFVDDGGRIGLGTNTPVVDLHTKSGDTPTLRLEQDGSSAFTPQTWDVAGNDANFFIRDTTNGSTLPFRIFPGAPGNALTIEASTGDLGVGTASPEAPLEISRSGASTSLRLTALGADPNKSVDLIFTDGDHEQVFQIDIDDGDLDEFSIDHNGNVAIKGTLRAASQGLPDYVFNPEYPLLSLSELAEFIGREQHLPGVPSNAEIQERGSLDLNQMQLALLEKVEELTLYTLSQEAALDALRAKNEALEERLAALERAVTR